MRNPRGLYSGCFVVLISLVIVLAFGAVLYGLNGKDKGPGAELRYPANHEDRLEAEVASDAAYAPPPGQTTKIQDRAAPDGSPPRTGRKRVDKVARTTANASPSAIEKVRSIWRYDGALLRLQAMGRIRRFYYVRTVYGSPAKDGAIAFEGVREGQTFSGRAFVFAPACAPLPYSVRGSISADETAIKLQGSRPVPDAQCNVKSYNESELVFVSAATP